MNETTIPVPVRVVNRLSELFASGETSSLLQPDTSTHSGASSARQQESPEPVTVRLLNNLTGKFSVALLADLHAPATSDTIPTPARHHAVVVPVGGLPPTEERGRPPAEHNQRVRADAALPRHRLSIGAYRTARARDSETSTLKIFSGDVVIKRFKNAACKAPPKGGKRGSVSDFSKASAREYCRQVRNQPALNHVGVSGMATGTYADGFVPKDGVTVKRHINRMVKRLTRDGVGGYYMIEFQEARRAVHVHFQLSKAVSPIEWGNMWCGCSDQLDSLKALRVACHPKSSQVLKNSRGAAVYAAKYASKDGLQKVVPDDFAWSGRWWGSFNLPKVEPVHTENASGVCHDQLRRLLRRKAHSEASHYYRARIVGELHAMTSAADLVNAFGMSTAEAFARVRADPQDFKGWEVLTHRGNLRSGFDAVGKGIRRAMKKEAGIKPPRKSKDWDKLTFYGQGQFLQDNLERLQASFTADPVARALRIFGGKVVDRVKPVAVRRGA